MKHRYQKLCSATLSNNDGSTKDDGWKKMDLNFTFEIPQLSRIILQDERSKTLLKLKM